MKKFLLKYFVIVVRSLMITFAATRLLKKQPITSRPSSKPKAVSSLLLTQVATYAQAITGLMSIIVAFLAYQASIEFRHRDEIKDEMQITPVLSVLTSYSTDGADLKFANVGLGPAIISGVYLRAKSHEIAITKPKVDLLTSDRGELCFWRYNNIYISTRLFGNSVEV